MSSTSRAWACSSSSRARRRSRWRSSTRRTSRGASSPFAPSRRRSGTGSPTGRAVPSPSMPKTSSRKTWSVLFFGYASQKGEDVMKKRVLLSLALFLHAPLLLAAEPPKIDGANTAWMLVSATLVLFMTLPGLALFYGGLVRAKNVLSVLMQCFAITCVVTLAWVIVGYSIAFGDGGAANAWWGGLGKSFLAGIGVGTVKGSIPETVFAMYQMTFAIITPALVVGAYAERVKFSGMLFFSVAWLLLVYVPIAHWVWGDGWLQKMGLMDFAGGTVVHLNAGMAALVCALVLGRRKG